MNAKLSPFPEGGSPAKSIVGGDLALLLAEVGHGDIIISRAFVVDGKFNRAGARAAALVWGKDAVPLAPAHTAQVAGGAPEHRVR